jgi:hypothetical protein
MEEIYILSDGSQVDISNFSDFEKISFLSKNTGAKKQKGVAKSATVAPKKNQALSTDSSSENGSLEPKKYRLPAENDLETMQKRGMLPPPSATPRSTTDVKDMYGSPIDAQEKNYRDLKDFEILLNPAVDKDFNKRIKFDLVSEEKVKLPGQRIAQKIKGKSIGSKNDMKDFVENFADNPITGEAGYDTKFKVAKLKEKIRETDSDLIHPYLYYSSKNQQFLNPVEEEQVEDDFIERNYKSKELEAFGINPQDFDGYLNKKGYKDDFKKKEAEGLFTGDGRSFGGYDIGLARELARKKMLLTYMDEMKSRDVNRQDLNQELEIIQGVRDKKEIVNNDIFDPNGMAKYVENYFPTITKKLKNKDKENAKLYEESKKGGTDFFSWDTAEKIGRAGWSAVIDRTAQMTASGYEALGMTGTAEGIRMLDEENKFIRRDDRGIAYVSGKTVNYDGTKYIVDSKGQIYDAEAKIRVTDLFNDTLQKKLVEEAKYGPSDWTFSTQGAAVQTSGVMADMLLQAAITRGVGKLGTIAGEIRHASNVVKPASGFTSLLNDSSKLLRKVPLDRATGYSMIAQGTMGYAQGYEDTLKAARDNGINDKDAFELASAAGQRMAVLYGTTGVINPQTKLVENLFGSKNIIKKAIEQYTKTGKTGFVNYIDDIIKNTPRNLVEFAEEGGKEVVQENIQQGGEIGVNMMTNKDAGKKIMNEVMSGDDFMNTSILSFISSGLISKAKLPNFHAGDQATDNLTSLSTLAKNKKEFTKIIDGLVTKEVFTAEQADNLKKDVDIYANNVNKVPKNVSADGAMPIMRELDKVTKLQDEKETTDKAFHPQIDEKIDGIRENIAKIYFKDQMDLENKSIEAAIKKGVVKDIEMKNFSTSEDLKTYLVNELNVPEDVADDWSQEGGFALTSDVLKKYSKDPDLIPEGFQVILQNEEVAFKLGDSGIQQHEFLHGLLQKTIKNSPQAQMLLGASLGGELIKLDKALREKGSDERVTPDKFIERLNLYADRSRQQKVESLKELEAGEKTQEAHDADVAKSEGNRWEEVMTLYSDALRLGYITYNEGTFTKLGDTIRRVLQYLGIRDIKFDSGKDVYNFIKDYNASAKSGKWGKAFTKMGTKGANINKEALSKEIGGNVVRSQAATSGPKFSLGDRKSSEDIKKDINKTYNKDTWSKDINSDRKTTLYDILTEYEYIIKGKAKGLGYFNLPDFSEYDFISETQIAMIPHVRNFNKEFLAKREEYKQELESKGLDPNSKEFKDKVQAQDEKGYQGKKGIVKENDDLNAWINSQLSNKMKDALKTGNVTTQKFTEDIEGEMFKESTIVDGFGGDSSYLADEGDSVYEAEQDFEEEQSRLAVLLSDPVFNFVDEQGKPIDIETVPFGSNFVTEVSDMSIAANKKLRTETDPAKIVELKRQLKDLERGLELQNKKDLTYEEKEELKSLKSFKSYDLSTGMTVNTFEALSIQDTPAKIITDEVAREILRSPNIETLEYRNFKERLSTMSKTMARRMTFKNGPEIESLMYREWQLLYDVINHPVDPVTNESSYASKKLPPRLKEFDEKGNLRKIGDITRTKFLQSYYGVEEATRILKIYGGDNASKQIAKLEEPELNEKTGKGLVPTAYFDRRTALMELFGDVMVLQEARRLLRQPDFLDRVADRNVNLYNSLKDDVLRAEVLKDMSKGKSDIVKFSLAETKENKEFKEKFKGLTSSKKYIEFQDKLKNHTLYHSGSESLDRTFRDDDMKALWFYVDDDTVGDWGDGVMYETKVKDLSNAIIIPDINDVGNFHEIIKKKYPKAVEEIKNNNNGIFRADLRDIIKTSQANEILNDWIDWATIKGNLSWDIGQEDIYDKDGVIEGTPVIVFGNMPKTSITKKISNKPDIIKFSLAEEENGKLSNFLEGLPFSKQWLVARDIDNAIERAKTATYAETEETEKLNQKIEKETDKVKKKELKRQLQEVQGGKITFKVPSRSKMSDKSTAYFIIQKVAEGYNDFEFRVKKNAEGPLTKQVLDALDFKSDKVQERMRLNNNLEQGMNEIIEQNKGVEASETFSPETAKNLGKNIGKYDIYLPPEDEDFLGLLYTLGSGKGQQGQDQMDFLVDNLLKPYSEAMLNVMKSRQTMYKDWKDLINKKYKGISKELKQDSGYGGYLVDQAVRVYLWNSAGYEVPGLDKKDLWHLKELVRKDKRLRDFAQDVSLLSKQPNGYTEPDHNWGFGSVVGDINNVISKSNRTKYLGVWQTNVDKIFSKQNMSKIEALYGRKYSKALENMLYRMKTGSNRAEGASDGLLNWINGSTAVTMFWNTRSALLQVIGGINYINTGDNNVVKAGLALLNIKQYTKDFLTIWNSNYLKDRRSGLMNDVAEAEFAQLMNDPRNNTLMDKFKAANYWFLKQGFTPTRVMDSFAIAFGGAGFYRNRINTYLKQGYSQDEAEKITMRDFYETSEISQQSADVSKISANQASTKGRLLLSFMNTPFQYSRIIKKSFIDIAKGRGSVPNNVAKIVYYSTIQNLMFNFLQNALFALLFDDDEEQKEGKYDQAKWRMLNGAMDTLIRGTGLTGVMLTTVKNALVKWYEKSGDPKGYGDVAAELANISPSIGIKLRSFIKAYKAVEYNAAEIEYEGFSLSNTYAIEALTSLTSLTFNLPADRMYQKMQNIKNALDDEYQTWQRVAFVMGYTEWNLGEGQSAPVQMNQQGTLKIPELKGGGGLVMPELK